MTTVNLYLNFAGNTEEAFSYYKSIFKTEFLELKRFSDTPFGNTLPEEERHKIMHISLPVGNILLMGTDTLSSQGHSLVMGNNFSISLDVESQSEADQLYAALSLNGKTTMTMQDTFWGGYFGTCTDAFGIQWMVQWLKKC